VTLYDVIIIGAGPSGLSAAIYAIRKSLKTLVISKDIGGQAALSNDIENYLGFSLVKGTELTAKFREHMDHFKDSLTLEEGVEVTQIQRQSLGDQPGFTVQTGDGKSHLGRTILIASGRTPRMLNVPGEREFLGKGVANCATCDAPFYKDKEVAIVGGGNSALDAALPLLKVAKKVTIINLTEKLTGDQVMLNQVEKSDCVTIYNNATTTKILGDSKVTGIEFKDSRTQETKTLEVMGVFIEVGWVPNAPFDKLTEKDSRGQIKVDAELRTSVHGIWAAGDINDQWGEQIIIASGEGAKAALSINTYLSKLPPLTDADVSAPAEVASIVK
jgi:alkyl hydroperoxide reductase subunit F